jgi:hypothetical protein
VTGHGDSARVWKREIGSILCDVLEWIEMMVFSDRLNR